MGGRQLGGLVCAGVTSEFGAYNTRSGEQTRRNGRVELEMVSLLCKSMAPASSDFIEADTPNFFTIAWSGFVAVGDGSSSLKKSQFILIFGPLKSLVNAAQPKKNGFFVFEN